MNAQIIRRTALAAAGALLTLSVPAAAKDVESRPAQANESASAQTGTAAKADKKYCITDNFTGSRMAKKVCRTAEEWSRQGIEVSAR